MEPAQAHAWRCCHLQGRTEHRVKDQSGWEHQEEVLHNLDEGDELLAFDTAWAEHAQQGWPGGGSGGGAAAQGAQAVPRLPGAVDVATGSGGPVIEEYESEEEVVGLAEDEGTGMEIGEDEGAAAAATTELPPWAQRAAGPAGARASAAAPAASVPAHVVPGAQQGQQPLVGGVRRRREAAAHVRADALMGCPD